MLVLVVVMRMAVVNQPDCPVLSAVQFMNTLSESDPLVSSHQVAISHFPVQVIDGSWRPGETVPGITVAVSQVKVVPS